jgi:hypothetical protein
MRATRLSEKTAVRLGRAQVFFGSCPSGPRRWATEATYWALRGIAELATKSQAAAEMRADRKP